MDYDTICDLRNALTPIKVWSQAILRRWDRMTVGEIRQGLEAVLECEKRIEGIVNEELGERDAADEAALAGVLKEVRECVRV